jgi:hypothetical protein
MTEDNVKEFLSSKYDSDKNNASFQRLCDLMFVQIPLVLCSGDDGLTQLSNKKITWDDYATQYTYGLEALVIFMFETQLDYLNGAMINDPQDPEVVSHSDMSSLTDVVPKKKGGRPKNKQPFCPKAHTACKTKVMSRRKESSPWFGWYETAVQSIGDQNELELERLRGNGGASTHSPVNDSRDNGITANAQNATGGEVSPEKELMEMELRMYNELQSKNKRARTSEDDGSGGGDGMLNTTNQVTAGINNSAYCDGEMIEPEDSVEYAAETVAQDRATGV